MGFEVESFEDVVACDGVVEGVGFGVDEMDDAGGDLFVPFVLADFGDAVGFLFA